MSFSDWTLSLSIMISKVHPCCRIYQYFLIMLIVSLYDIPYFCIHPSADGHLVVSIFFLALMNNTDSVHTEVSMGIFSNFLAYVFMSIIAGSHSNSVFNTLRNCQAVLKQIHHFIFSSAIYEYSNFFTSSPTSAFACLSYFSHPSG